MARRATVTRTIKHEDGTKTFEDFGAVIDSPIPGVYNLLLNIPTDEKNEKGYPKTSPIIAFKAENGEKVVDSPRKDGARVFYSITVWENDLEAKPSNR